MQKIRALMLVGLVALLLGGCAGLTPGSDAMTDMDHGAMATQTPLEGIDSASTMTGTQAMTDTRAMTNGQMSDMDHSAMTMDPAKPFDAQFIDSMIEHHQGAIVMAEQALEQAEQPELRNMAEEVIAAQTKEIEEMTAWRQVWYPDLPPTGGVGMGMGEMAISTDESKSFDQRFIEAMISHHQGAIEMAKLAQHMAEHQEIKTLAEAIITAQEAEIELMQGWLTEWVGESAAPSPYVAELASPVRGLNAQEVDDLLAGRGMGFARMAELNSYPGPRHLLDLQTELKLSPAQLTAIEAIFSGMQGQAQQLGQEIVVQEGQLSAAFANGEPDESALEQHVMKLAGLYGQLRATHLRAHLQVAPLLTPEQIMGYNEHRGYTRAGQSPDHQMHP